MKKNIKNRIFTICVMLIISIQMVLQGGCSFKKEAPVKEESLESKQERAVVITDKSNYYDVKIDFTTGLNHYDIGVALAKKILKSVPDYEKLIDSYLAENVTKEMYPSLVKRVNDIKPQLNNDYVQELDGMASVFSGADTNELKDDKLSKEELYLYNLIPDVLRLTACCFTSVYGSRSETNNNILARNLDWASGKSNQLPKVSSVVTMKYSDKSVCSVGFLGFMGMITGVNNSKIFAAIMDSRTGASYSSTGKRSYVFDLRNDLENKTTLNDATEFMRSDDKQYTVNHLICFADAKKSVVLENNFSGKGSDGQQVRRAVRDSDSVLNKGITWGISDALGVVNSFLLYGNTDAHTTNKYNTLRWDNMKNQLLAKGPKVSFDQLKEVISYYTKDAPGDFNTSGDLYNKQTLQMFVFEPESNHLEVYFRPRNSSENSAKPVFDKISLFN